MLLSCCKNDHKYIFSITCNLFIWSQCLVDILQENASDFRCFEYDDKHDNDDDEYKNDEDDNDGNHEFPE